MPDAGPVRDEVAALRAVNARLRAVIFEPGFRVAGKLAWVHSASSGRYALITVHPRRGREAVGAAGVLPRIRRHRGSRRAKHGIGMLDALTRAASGAAGYPEVPDNRASVRGFTAPPRARRPMNPASWARLTGVRETTAAEDHLRPTITPRESQR